MLNLSFATACSCTPEMVASWDDCAWCEAQSYYSDCFKERYGVRPRGDFSGWSAADFREEAAWLCMDERQADRAATMPLGGRGWSVAFQGDQEDARNRYAEDASVW